VRGGAAAAWAGGGDTAPDSDDEDLTGAAASPAAAATALPPTAIAELRSTLLPVRAHALMALTDFARCEGRAIAPAIRARLLGLFRTALLDADSYVFLTAAGGLAALAEFSPREVVPLVARGVATGCLGTGGGAADAAPDGGLKMPLEARVKLCEALVRIVERLGALAPSYSEVLVGSALEAVREAAAGGDARCG
jgi:hypothetical protein